MPRSSTTSRSASPLAWATQTPPHARMMGSIAVTTPLAGVSGTIVRPCRTWLTGSRFETTTSGRSPSRARANWVSRSSVHTASPRRRRRASSAIATRARARLRARSRTSEARGPNSAGIERGRRRAGLAGPELTRPLRHPVQGMRHAAAHHEHGDQAQHGDEHGEPDQVLLRQLPPRAVDVARVREDDQHAAGPVVAEERHRVVVGLAIVDGLESLLGRDVDERERHGRQGRVQLGGPLGCHGDHRPGAVVHRDAARRGSEALDDALDLAAGALVDEGLHGLLEPLAEQPRATLELGGQTGALPLDRDVRERPEDDDERQPNGRQQAQIEAHAQPV